MKGEYIQFGIDNNDSATTQFEFSRMPKFFSENSSNLYHAHTHNFYQIIWFQRGRGVHYVDFKEYEVCENMLFFISPGQIHYFENNQDFEGIVIHFNESFLSNDTSSDSIFMKYNLFNAFDSAPFCQIKNEDCDKLNYLADEMERETGCDKEFAHTELFKNLIVLFLITSQRIVNRDSKIALSASSSSHCVFVRFRQLLENNYRELHSVKEYANLLCVSTKTLTNCVYQSSNSTPLKIINDRIILEAKRQLTHSSRRVKEIGFQLGFEDSSYFVKFFKRHTGHLPTEFRDI